MAIARRFAGEIVNYDSVQIYRYFDIGSAKPSIEERQETPHHLIDVAEPWDSFTAGDYAMLARRALSEIRARRKLPVLVGGTGFYLRALVDGLFPGPRRDAKLRERLEQRATAKPAGYLGRLLARLDPAAAERIHANDKPKLIRAIEVCLAGRAPITSQWRQAGRDRLTGYHVIRIGLEPERETLGARIRIRTQAMFERGLIDEVRAIVDRGVGCDARAFESLGYRQALAVLDGRMTEPAAIEETILRTRQYAKRQMTWFRREKEVYWLPGFGNDPQVSGAALNYLEPLVKTCIR